MEIKTSSGFTCKLDVDALNDWELYEILLDGGELVDSRFCRAVMQKCMSKADVEKLKKHVKTDDGRIPATAIVTEIMEILGKIKQEKNS
jgi:hypothetical protein